MFIVEQMIALVAPFACQECGHEGTVVCTACRPARFPRLPGRCFRCVRPSRNFAVCASCRQPGGLRQVWIRTGLGESAEQLIYTFKFERAQAAAAVIAELMQEALPALPGPAVLVPVPSATSRVRQRGYDHTLLLARALAHLSGLEYRSLLRRQGQSRQVGASRAERLRQIRGAFEVTAAQNLRGAHLVLVDDIVTTGATLSEAARTLRAAGARRIDALVFAQK